MVREVYGFVVTSTRRVSILKMHSMGRALRACKYIVYNWCIKDLNRCGVFLSFTRFLLYICK